jgi:serine/threonine protein kinase
MHVQVRCPNHECGATLSVPDERIGRNGRCGKCGTSFVVTAPASVNAPEGAIACEPARAFVSTISSSPSNPGLRSRTPPTELPEQFGRFRILGRLGRGGMGSVYKAFDSQIHRQVALKIPHLSSQDGPEVLERFYREARIAATFDHPHLCPVYTVDQIDGVHYIAMPLLDGQPLSKCLENRHPLPQRPVAALVRMLALAMEEAHSRGVVHRDLKPSNIMAERNRLVVIVDFGLSLRSGWLDPARREAVPVEGDGRITKAGSVLGTPAYMAPEQVYGDAAAIGPSCDIYSLGVILYELLTGHVPFEGPTSVVLGLIKVSEPARPSALRPDVKPSLEAICLKAMAKKPGDRFSSMAELAASLKVFLDHGEYTQAGMVPAELLKPKLAPHDALTTEERQLVESLLAGTAHDVDGRRPEPRTWVPRIRDSQRGFLVISAVTAALCLIVAMYLFGNSRATPRQGSPNRAGQDSPPGPVTGNPRSKAGPENGAQPPARKPEQRPSLKLVRSTAWQDKHIFYTAFSPDSKLYLGMGDGGTLRIWEVATGYPVLELRMEPGPFTPDSKQIVGHGSGRKTISFFDLPSGQLRRTWDLSEAVVGLAIAPDGTQVVSSHSDKVLRLWDFQSRQEIRRLEGSFEPTTPAFSPDGKQVLAASSKDKIIRLWDVETGRLARTFEHFLGAAPFQGHDLIVAAFFLPGGGQMAGYVWGKERTLLVWDVADGKVVRKLDLGSDHHKDLAISPDGRWFLTAHEGRPATVRLRDLTTGKEVDRFALASAILPRAPSFSPDGRFAASGSYRGWVYLWQLVE